MAGRTQEKHSSGAKEQMEGTQIKDKKIIVRGMEEGDEKDKQNEWQ